MNDVAEQDEPIINIRGQKIGLGPLEPSQVPQLARWINNFETSRSIGVEPRPMTRAQEEEWARRVTTDGDAVMFLIYDLEDMTPVGTVGLFDIDRLHGTCELGVGIMEPERRGKGLGTEAVQLITDYAIHARNMHNVQLKVFAFNWAGLRAYAKAGFRETGRRREAHFHNGRRWDVIQMDVIASEWESPVMERMMSPEDERR